VSFFKNSKGYTEVPLIDIATLKRGYDLPVQNRVAGNVPIFAANGQNGTHNQVKKLGPGVVTGRSGTIGKVHYVNGEYWPLNTSLYVTDFHGNHPRWVFYMLQAFRLERYVEGAGVPTLNRNLVHGEKIPLPPLNEQKRIAAILDKADSLRRKRQQAIQLADQFLRSVFLDLFGDPVTNPKGWEVCPMSHMAEVITGNTPSRKQPEYYGDYIEWIKSDNINTPSNFLTTSRENLSVQGYKVGRKVPEGSTLITCIAGSFECIGNAAFADREVCFNQQINALVPLTVKPWFLYGLILFSKKKIQAASTNAMKGMVSKGTLEKIEMIFPPIELQEKFEELFDKHRKLTSKMNRSSRLADKEFFSLSQKAFAGEL